MAARGPQAFSTDALRRKVARSGWSFLALTGGAGLFFVLVGVGIGLSGSYNAPIVGGFVAVVGALSLGGGVVRLRQTPQIDEFVEALLPRIADARIVLNMMDFSFDNGLVFHQQNTKVRFTCLYSVYAPDGAPLEVAPGELAHTWLQLSLSRNHGPVVRVDLSGFRGGTDGAAADLSEEFRAACPEVTVYERKDRADPQGIRAARFAVVAVPGNWWIDHGPVLWQNLDAVRMAMDSAVTQAARPATLHLTSTDFVS